jgi:hypothetical protein
MGEYIPTSRTGPYGSSLVASGMTGSLIQTQVFKSLSRVLRVYCSESGRFGARAQMDGQWPWRKRTRATCDQLPSHAGGKRDSQLGC